MSQKLPKMMNPPGCWPNVQLAFPLKPKPTLSVALTHPFQVENSFLPTHQTNTRNAAGIWSGGQGEGNASSHLAHFRVGNQTLKKKPKPPAEFAHLLWNTELDASLCPSQLTCTPNIWFSGGHFFYKSLQLLWRLTALI